MKLTPIAIAAAFMLGAGSAEAALIVTVNVPAAGGLQDFGTGDASVTYDGITFSQSAALSNGVLSHVTTNYAPPVVASHGQTQGVANILITLPRLVDSVVITYGTFDGGIVDFTVSTGESFILGSHGSGYATFDTYYSDLPDNRFKWIRMTNASVLSISSVTFTVLDAPEPATWGMMLIGFGMVGAAMRTRRKPAVRFA